MCGKQNEACNGIKLDKTWGLIILIIAIAAAPGYSTILAGFMEADRPNIKDAVLIGIVQFLLVPVLVGWIWAIMTAWKIYNNSK